MKVLNAIGIRCVQLTALIENNWETTNREVNLLRRKEKSKRFVYVEKMKSLMYYERSENERIEEKRSGKEKKELPTTNGKCSDPMCYT